MSEGGHAGDASKAVYGKGRSEPSPFSLLMDGNPSTCTAARADDAGAGGGTTPGVVRLVCACGNGYAGDGTFCISKPTAVEVCRITDSTTSSEVQTNTSGVNRRLADAEAAVIAAKQTCVDRVLSLCFVYPGGPPPRVGCKHSAGV